MCVSIYLYINELSLSLSLVLSNDTCTPLPLLQLAQNYLRFIFLGDAYISVCHDFVKCRNNAAII